MTSYVVLRRMENDAAEPVYQIVGTVEASNSEQAVRRIVERMSDNQLGTDGVTHVAVPARNWSAGTHTFTAMTQRKLLTVDAVPGRGS